MTSCTTVSRVAVMNLPDLPDPHGVAGAFAGVVDGRLLVGGGANFPDGVMPWAGGRKVWHDQVVALDLDAPSAGWREVGRLPTPNGYGVSLTTPDGVLVIGGGDAERHFTEVWAMRLDGGRAALRQLPSLPRPLAQMAGALVGRVVHVVGGVEHPQATEATAAHWALDLDDVAAGWRALPPLPGPGRILATASTVGDTLLVFGGCALAPDASGAARRTYLRDAWMFARGAWTRLADMPRASAAAASPAPADGRSVFVVAGDDGSQALGRPAEHRGFTREILRYDLSADAWASAGALDIPAPVTLPTAPWRNGFIFVSGEVRPGVRTPRVFLFRPSEAR
jgi:N-acetylneuraminic acid mutarotase